ncbi:MAG: AAA family ATPase [Bacteriovoracaceae bacterium]
MLKRETKQIQTWLNAQNRKPLILQGQRQVGKTYFITKIVQDLIKPQGKVFVVDFIADKMFKQIFQTETSPNQIIKKLEIHQNIKINLENDLLFLDEIQESSEAIQSLKYFYEQIPLLKIVCAGSFLGIMHNESSFPVGKVEFENLGPLSFEEFLENSHKEIYEFYSTIDINKNDPIEAYFHQRLLEYFSIYLCLGGMPEVIETYLTNLPQGQNEALNQARKIQKQIILGYQSDFAKYAGVNNASHILHVYDAIPSQLNKKQNESVNKFTFSNVIPKSKGFNKIQGPLTWLEKSRLVIKTFICNKADTPLKAYTKENHFKLYYSDVGLLQCALEIPISKSVSMKMGEYKGYIAENFVATQIYLKSFSTLYSWSEGESEIEFLIYFKDEILPIEVKSTANFSRARSLDSFIKRYTPNLAVKLAPLNLSYNNEKKILTLPIYLVNKL